MKTAYGKLALMAFALVTAALLFVPAHIANDEDRIALRPDTLKISTGGSYQLECTYYTRDDEADVRFRSSNTHVAGVSGGGLVTARAVGTATITAQLPGGASDTMEVCVDGTPMRTLSLNTEELHMRKHQVSGLTASYNSDATDTRLSWVSGNTNVVTVDSAGRVEGVGGGHTTVSVIAANGLMDTAMVYVDVAGTALHMSPNALTLGVGARVPLRTAFLPLDCTDTVRRFTSSDPRVLSVSSKGVLSAVGEGTAFVTVLSEGGLSEVMGVTVEAAPKDLQLEPSGATLERGTGMNLQVLFLNDAGQAQDGVSHLVTWKSSDESVATVDQSGYVKAMRSGDCVITAAADGFTAECHLHVQVTIQEIMLERTEYSLLREDANQPLQLHWTISPQDPDDPTVHFVSNNTQVANVSDTGLITLTGGYGTAVITAYSDSSATADFTVNVVTQLTPAETPTTAPTAEPAAAPVAEDVAVQGEETAMTPTEVPEMTVAPTAQDSIG